MTDLSKFRKKSKETTIQNDTLTLILPLIQHPILTLTLILMDL